MYSAMRPGADRDTIFDQLWTVAHGAFDERDYETACHALDAALSRAHALGDAARVMAVGRAAEQQHNRLFQQSSDATDAAELDAKPDRQHTIQMVYASIARQAPAIVNLIQLGV